MASPIEFCDLYSLDRKIIHVKRYGGSDVLSHLFAQGTVSAELFLLDSNFRVELNTKLPPEFKLENPESRLNPGSYTIFFAIVYESDGPLKLPFFSRVSLRQAFRRLEGFGFNVGLLKIDVEPGRKILKKYRRMPKAKAATT